MRRAPQAQWERMATGAKREHGQGDLLTQANPNRQAVRVQAPSNESLSNESDTALRPHRSSTSPSNYGAGLFLINKRSRWCMLLGGQLCCDGRSVQTSRETSCTCMHRPPPGKARHRQAHSTHSSQARRDSHTSSRVRAQRCMHARRARHDLKR